MWSERAGSRAWRALGLCGLLLGACRSGVAVDPRAEQLVAACRSGDSRRALELLAQGVSPNARDASNVTPLMAAACDGHPDLVSLVIERLKQEPAQAKGGTLDAFDNGEWSALRCAARVEPVGMQPGWSVASARHLEAVRLLLAAGANVNAMGGGGRTPLMEAARTRQLPIVRELLGAGAAVDARDREGRTALWYATSSVPLRSWGEGLVQETSVPVIVALLAGGAAVDARDRDGRTPLFEASARSHAAEVRALLHAGADPNAKANPVLGRGMTALLEAAGRGATETAALLVRAGADVSATTADGRSALVEAAASGSLATVELLLDSGAEVNPQSRRSRETALWVAARQGHVDMVRLLLHRGARPAEGAADSLEATGDPRILALLRSPAPAPRGGEPGAPTSTPGSSARARR